MLVWNAELTLYLGRGNRLVKQGIISFGKRLTGDNRRTFVLSNHILSNFVWFLHRNARGIMDNRINNYWIHWGEEKAGRKCDHRVHPLIGVEDNQTDTLSDTPTIPLWICSYQAACARHTSPNANSKDIGETNDSYNCFVSPHNLNRIYPARHVSWIRDNALPLWNTKLDLSDGRVLRFQARSYPH